MITVQVTGAKGVREMLADYTTPKLPRRLQTATDAGAQVFVPPLRAEARKVSKRMGRAVTRKRARRERPASLVTFNRRRAFFAHFVIGGTRAHSPRRARVLAWPDGNFARRVRGVPPNPMVERVARAYEGRAYQAIDQSLDSTETT